MVLKHVIKGDTSKETVEWVMEDTGDSIEIFAHYKGQKVWIMWFEKSDGGWRRFTNRGHAELRAEIMKFVDKENNNAIKFAN